MTDNEELELTEEQEEQLEKYEEYKEENDLEVDFSNPSLATFPDPSEISAMHPERRVQNFLIEITGEEGKNIQSIEASKIFCNPGDFDDLLRHEMERLREVPIYQQKVAGLWLNHGPIPAPEVPEGTVIMSKNAIK